MTVKRTGLGRNLSALLGPSAGTSPTSAQGLQHIALARLQPGVYQPRREFDDEAIQELASSIRKQGVLQPILVRVVGEKQFEILAGERRFRAALLAGLTEIPAIVKTVTDEEALAIALVENLQREDLNVLEQARAMERLMSTFSLTQQQVAELLSKSRPTVGNLLRLLNLPELVQQFLAFGDLDMGHARALLMLNEALQVEIATLVVEKKLSVRATEALVNRMKTGERIQVELPPSPELDAYLQALNTSLKTKVEIKPGAAGRGKVVIHFENQDSLAALVERLG